MGNSKKTKMKIMKLIIITTLLISIIIASNSSEENKNKSKNGNTLVKQGKSKNIDYANDESIRERTGKIGSTQEKGKLEEEASSNDDDHSSEDEISHKISKEEELKKSDSKDSLLVNNGDNSTQEDRLKKYGSLDSLLVNNGDNTDEEEILINNNFEYFRNKMIIKETKLNLDENLCITTRNFFESVPFNNNFVKQINLKDSIFNSKNFYSYETFLYKLIQNISLIRDEHIDKMEDNTVEIRNLFFDSKKYSKNRYERLRNKLIKTKIINESMDDKMDEYLPEVITTHTELFGNLQKIIKHIDDEILSTCKVKKFDSDNDKTYINELEKQMNLKTINSNDIYTKFNDVKDKIHQYREKYKAFEYELFEILNKENSIDHLFKKQVYEDTLVLFNSRPQVEDEFQRLEKRILLTDAKYEKKDLNTEDYTLNIISNNFDKKVD